MERLSEGLGGHLRLADSELGQTRTLLANAVQKLSVCFEQLHEQAQACREPGELAPGGGGFAQHVNGVVMGLQFQDLADQLLALTSSRIDGLRSMLGQLERLLAPGARQDAACADLAQVFGDARQLIEFRLHALADSLARPVAQTSLGSGDIELF